MKSLRLFLIALITALPALASAHALPTAYVPDASAVLTAAPTELSIMFSERIDASASSVRVLDPAGTLVSGKLHLGEDPHTLIAPLTAQMEGAYSVAWSVVSSDDGHFTKGSYLFAVGKGQPVPAQSAESEIVQVASAPEVFGMTVELVGNGFLWAALVLFAFAVRPLLRKKRYGADERLIHRGYALFILGAVSFALAGGAVQLYVKSVDLAALQSLLLSAAALSYAQTAAGAATLGRMLCAFLVGVVFLLGKKRIADSAKLTVYELAMFALMCVFAYLRAKISHATANPFLPDLSIAVNFVHLIEKDIWAGILGILLVAILIPRLREFAADLLPKAFAFLAIDLAAVSATAAYIVWLHLKSFSNLFTTAWGEAFQHLLLAAVFLVALRTYHVFARFKAPRIFSRLLPATLAAELAFALLVIYASSVIIITSPPLAHRDAVESVRSNGQTITVSRAVEDSAGLIALSNPDAAGMPTATLDGRALTLAKRFDGGYAFPLLLLPKDGEATLSISAPQAGSYDAVASFPVSTGSFVPTSAFGGRGLDAFTFMIIAIAFAALGFAVMIHRLSCLEAEPARVRGYTLAASIAPITLIICVSLGIALMDGLSASGFANPYKQACEADGNMWHVMLPSMAGKAVSSVPQEGCMWGMGEYLYQFPDRREYDYYSTLGHAEVSLAHEVLSVGVPATLTFSLKNADGSPATLFYDMDKRIHVVIVSEDEKVFAHIHPDDLHPLPQSAIDTSTFSVSYAFPKAGKYLVSADYAHGLSLESKQFVVEVAGAAMQSDIARYPSLGQFDGYTVSLDPGAPVAGEVDTIRYVITKDGKPVMDIVPYLSAAAHISVVKDDLSSFIHTHGEVHPPGTPYPPIIIKNGQVVHSMAAMTLPPTFGPNIEAHLIFPTPGMYTVWGEFNMGGKVIPTAFTVRVE